MLPSLRELVDHYVVLRERRAYVRELTKQVDADFEKATAEYMARIQDRSIWNAITRGWAGPYKAGER